MIKYNLKELMAKKAFSEGKNLTITDISAELGISRSTLSKMANSKGDFSTKTEYLEKLCNYFGCSVQELMTIIPDPPESRPPDARE